MGATTHLLHYASIFIAPGFEESFVVQCTVYLRKAGIPIGLMGVRPGEVVGANGVGICPDYFLDGWKPSSSPQLLILPGGVNSIKRWMIEPRLFRIVQYILDHGGILALAKNAERIFSSGFLKFHPSQSFKVLMQYEMTHEEFTRQIYMLALKNISKTLKARKVLRQTIFVPPYTNTVQTP